ncbi:DUF3352 domain-containing protein [Conexibacter stalactiti]|uniref:DUF3352 domain-containing protein n=1 Tax=Conexibacter stalactiti TaxID=1940611 RepID=A0ABU4HWP8_9ACTN|nr:DUF3352 domain-containing protein [Conexibacter stalactiti]MDW5597751.1 DUF3352 domain-containing protein [Conexibacter stalactiti]MEC5038393.1 DUF3352 domain-containing protein [Conexibacter stalactiti]
MSTARRATPRRRPLPPVLRDWRAGVGLLALIVAVVALIAFSGGSGEHDGPPASDAAALVPADALAFLHLSTDGDRAPVQRALALARRLGAESTLQDQLGGLLGGGDGATPVDFDRDVRPWLGAEAALALTDEGRGTAGSLLLLSVTDEEGARDYLARTAGPARRGRYEGTATASYGNGTVSAFVGGFLAVGQQATVRGAIDRERGAKGARALADDADYRRATAGQPRERALDAYATVDGVRRLLAPASGLLGIAGTLLDQPGLRATGLSLSAEEHAARMRITTVLDPRGRTRPATFTPTLAGSIPADAIAYLGFPGLERAAPLLLSLGGLGGAGAAGSAQGGAAGLAGDTAALLSQAGRLLAADGVVFARDVLPLFGGEVAIVAVPVDGTPQLALLARVGDTARAAAGLRRLEPAIARLFTPAGGEAPTFADAKAGGVASRRLESGEGFEVDYALSRGTLAVSTSQAALAAVVRPRGSIDGNTEYKAVIGRAGDVQSELTSIVFFDFSQLLSLFEPLGLTSDSGLGADLQRIGAVGLTSTGGEAQTTAELTFEIP